MLAKPIITAGGQELGFTKPQYSQPDGYWKVYSSATIFFWGIFF